MTPEQMQAHLQQCYDEIKDPAKKAEFIKTLTHNADGMVKLVETISPFAKLHQ